MRVKTGALWDAGTTCKVNIFLTGEFGDSGPRSLWQPTSHNEEAFQQDQVGLSNKRNYSSVEVGDRLLLVQIFGALFKVSIPSF